MSAPDFDAEAYALGLGLSLGIVPGTPKSAELAAAIEHVRQQAYEAGARDERERCAQEYRALNELAARAGKHFARGGGNG